MLNKDVCNYWSMSRSVCWVQFCWADTRRSTCELMTSTSHAATRLSSGARLIRTTSEITSLSSHGHKAATHSPLVRTKARTRLKFHCRPMYLRNILMSEWICLSVCILAYLQNHTLNLNLPNFLCMWLWPPGRGSVLFCWHCDRLCTSGFVDDVVEADCLQGIQLVKDWFMLYRLALLTWQTDKQTNRLGLHDLLAVLPPCPDVIGRKASLDIPIPG